MTEPLTRGVHHVGLVVPELGAAVRFFVQVLGWKVCGGVPSYPAVFVTDGAAMVTLWRVADPGTATAFDRRANIGLHHLALKVASRADLAAMYNRVRLDAGVAIEFAPGPMREGSPLHHFICTMPGGVRLEFATTEG